MKKLVIIDGKSVFYRGYYAMGSLSLKDGTPTGGVYGFASIFLAVLAELKPSHVIVAWDKQGTSTAQRTALYPAYKATRKAPPEDFFTQIPILHQLLEALNVPLIELDGYEADDLMGALAVQAAQQGFEVGLVTGDLDLLQVIDDGIKVFATKTGFSKIEQFDQAHFEAKYQIKLSQFVDYKALRGDSSDNIPGVAGIGPKTAVELLTQYANLEQIYAHLADIKPTLAKKLEAGREMAFLSKKIVRIMTEAPVKFDPNQGQISQMAPKKALTALDQLEFRSLKNRLATILGVGQPTSGQTDLFNNQPAVAYDDISSVEELIKIMTDQPKILVEIIDQKIFISGLDSEAIYALELTKTDDNFYHWLKTKTVISSDIKQLLHNFSNSTWRSLAELPLDKYSIYDINQASFLLDPLARNHQIIPTINQLPYLKQLYRDHLLQWAKLPKLAQVAKQLDFPLALVLYLTEKRGVEIDQRFFAEFGRELTERIEALTEQIYQLAGERFNINSPAQLSHVLFETLALPTTGLKKRTAGFSTDRQTLDALHDALDGALTEVV